MQSLIITGKLPSTKDECATLAALNLRIYELSYMRMMEEEEERRRMKLAKKRSSRAAAAAAAGGTESATPSCSLRHRRESRRRGTDAETATRVDVSVANDEPSVNQRVSERIQEEDENEAEAEETAPAATTTTTTKTTTIEVIKKKRSSSAASKPVLINLHHQRDSLVSIQSQTLIMPVIVSNGCESMLIYLRSCSCFSSHAAARIVSVGQLVSPNYQRSNDMLKLIKLKKDKLSKTSYFNNELKLKECYVKMCRNLNCFGCVLFTVKEIVYETNPHTGVVSFKKVSNLCLC